VATRSDVTINKLLHAEFSSGLPASTMYRHLRIRGATKIQLGVVKDKVRCRWTRDTPNSMWMGDFSHGPLALAGGKARQTHSSVWIDTQSRFLVEARYYVRENLGCLVDSLLRALATLRTAARWPCRTHLSDDRISVRIANSLLAIARLSTATWLNCQAMDC